MAADVLDALASVLAVRPRNARRGDRIDHVDEPRAVLLVQVHDDLAVPVGAQEQTPEQKLAALDDVLVRHDPTDWSRWPSLRERWEPLGTIEVMSCGLRPRSAAVGEGIPSKVSNRYRSRSSTPAASRVRATAIMLPPRPTPHSTIAPGTRFLETYSTALTSAYTRVGVVIVYGRIRPQSSMSDGSKSGG